MCVILIRESTWPLRVYSADCAPMVTIHRGLSDTSAHAPSLSLAEGVLSLSMPAPHRASDGAVAVTLTRETTHCC